MAAFQCQNRGTRGRVVHLRDFLPLVFVEDLDPLLSELLGTALSASLSSLSNVKRKYKGTKSRSYFTVVRVLLIEDHSR